MEPSPRSTASATSMVQVSGSLATTSAAWKRTSGSLGPFPSLSRSWPTTTRVPPGAVISTRCSHVAAIFSVGRWRYAATTRSKVSSGRHSETSACTVVSVGTWATATVSPPSADTSTLGVLPASAWASSSSETATSAMASGTWAAAWAASRVWRSATSEKSTAVTSQPRPSSHAVLRPWPQPTSAAEPGVSSEAWRSRRVFGPAPKCCGLSANRWSHPWLSMVATIPKGVSTLVCPGVSRPVPIRPGC